MYYYKTSWEDICLLGHFSSGSFDNWIICSLTVLQLSLGTVVSRDIFLLGHLIIGLFAHKELSLGTVVSWKVVSWDSCIVSWESDTVGTLLRCLSHWPFVSWAIFLLGNMKFFIYFYQYVTERILKKTHPVIR